MKKKIKRYAKKSSIMDVVIKYQGETVSFNLNDELKIDENRINSELKDQPSYYGFLVLLNNKLERIEADKKASLGSIHSELLIKAKSDTDPATGRPYNNDLAEAIVQSDKTYQKALKDYNKAKENRGIVSSCVESFNQRSHLLQTLSANVRKERENS